ncbi:MAG: DUF2752 domain-containing protein [Bacteroidales bacterium]|nr:DUF2752 domain-containing protein [Bacteroidales bacterium]
MGIDLYLPGITALQSYQRMVGLIHWLEQHQLPCIYQKVLGIPCPACGLQRSFIELLKGDLIGSVKAYPPLIPVLFLFALAGLHLIFRFNRGASLLKITALVIGAIMTVNYILTIIGSF